MKLKLKVGGYQPGNTPSSNRPSASPAPPAYVPAPTIRIPSATPNPTPKFKLKLGPASSQSSPAPSKKPKDTKLLRLNVKAPRQTLTYEPGNGYDSESSEREQDPLIEEQFILRMPPGDDCDYLRQAIEEKSFDGRVRSKDQDVWIKFKDQRRAVINVRGQLYAAVLWDLPCVVESCKTLDKKNTFKTADIAHILEVQAPITHESEALAYPPPTTFTPTPGALNPYAYPHGLTAPLKYVRKRRFRRPRFERPIDSVHDEVRRLLTADAEAVQTSNELVDASEMQRCKEESEEPFRSREDSYFGGRAGPSGALRKEEDYDDEDDVEMEDVPLGDATMASGAGEEEEEEFDLFDELNAALADPDPDPAESLPPPTPTPAPESSDDEDDDLFEDVPGASEAQPGVNNANSHLDEAAQERAQETQKIREELADLQGTLEEKLKGYEAARNQILKDRIRVYIEDLRAEIRMKEQMLKGEGGEDDDEDMGGA
ncbi:hypothetical protein BJ508DRAFT_369570 [Ascobolus immersus RN42]|uniref:TAFII55 protein conserved region domain-containing protein n=1 Tax=Ascobolus immersus RN42 TaxID=1160509 RepID=A0A3N4IA75_ASCIM|nr:hypothetical protein BJ508DRAFT_369570 [Ascobolus immersus RN42]